MIFEVGKNPPKMTKVRTRGGQRENTVLLKGGVGGTGRNPRNCKESDRNWQESGPRVQHAPAPARGAADLKASPHAADPQKYKLTKNVKNVKCKIIKN